MPVTPLTRIGWLALAASLAASPAVISGGSAAAARASASDPTLRAIRELEARVRENPDDFVSYNKLAGYYLQRGRETGDLGHLSLADRSARASLAVLPAEQNHGGLAAAANVAFAAHDFASARDYARRLTVLAPRRAASHRILGDTLLELGDYDEAIRAFRVMRRLDPGSVYTETRLARVAALYGRSDEAIRRYEAALAEASTLRPPSPETVAWCHVQLGEMRFAEGQYERAGRHFGDALAAFPGGSYKALGGLGKTRAAQGDHAGAIGHYERAVAMVPDPALVGALGDLYQLAGRDDEALVQFALVEQIGRLAVAGGSPYRRQLALFYADHDLHTAEAYDDAVTEYRSRRDVYGADAVAWTALRAGRVAEAREAMAAALRLGTRDARIWYHAGMIAQAAGDRSTARDHLRRALALSPEFDPRHAPIARRALDQLDAGDPTPTVSPLVPRIERHGP